MLPTREEFDGIVSRLDAARKGDWTGYCDDPANVTADLSALCDALREIGERARVIGDWGWPHDPEGCMCDFCHNGRLARKLCGDLAQYAPDATQAEAPEEPSIDLGPLRTEPPTDAEKDAAHAGMLKATTEPADPLTRYRALADRARAWVHAHEKLGRVTPEGCRAEEIVKELAEVEK
jgi:hypothetical protein